MGYGAGSSPRPLLRRGLTRMSRSNDDVGAVPYRTEAQCSAREEVCGRGVAACVRSGLGKHPTSQRASHTHTHMDEYPGVAKNIASSFSYFLQGDIGILANTC